MCRVLCRLLPGLLLFVLPLAPATAHEGHSQTIVGRLQPELLPETSVWEHVFFALHSLTGGRTDPRDPEVHSFVAGNLFLSDADAAALLEEAAALQARIKRLEQQQQEVARAGDRTLEEATLRKQVEE